MERFRNQFRKSEEGDIGQEPGASSARTPAAAVARSSSSERTLAASVAPDAVAAQTKDVGQNLPAAVQIQTPSPAAGAKPVVATPAKAPPQIPEAAAGGTPKPAPRRAAKALPEPNSPAGSAAGTC